ncbi:hypothetical protein FRB91_010663 [Serendipita sp. 411]|nr:hypothetical protein FRB91_010663 [Serendipita sp. 411]
MKVQIALSTVAACLGSAILAIAAPSPLQPGSNVAVLPVHKRSSPAHNFGAKRDLGKRVAEPRGYRDYGRWYRKSRSSCHAPTATSSTAPAATDGSGELVVTTTTPAADPAPTEGSGGGDQPVENPAPAPSSSEDAPSVPAATSATPEPAPTNSNPVIQEYLTAHNNERANHGAQALTWSDELAGYAQNWVNQCKWQHSSGPYGENLSMGTNMGATWAVQLWLDERSDYNAANPQYSHWTQVVWKGSQQLGCASQVCGNQVMHACEYYPPGNYIGQFGSNVQP